MYNILLYLKNNYLKLIIILLLIILIALEVFKLFFNDNNLDNIENSVEQIAYANIDKEENEITKKVKVDIKGAIKKSGVYLMDENSTIEDVIKTSGGLKNGATTDNINLSKKVYDEMVIYVSLKSELKKNNNCEVEKVEEKTIASKDTIVSEYNNIDANKELVQNSDKKEETTNSLVNINSATKEELLTISGIGESKADLIIEYRQTNKFNTIEDIKNVKGIGESLFNKIKDYITV